jgi:hypothetical protein
MSRKQPPNRRPNTTVETDWQGHPITVTVGYHPRTGKACEVFADVLRGGQMADTLRDACVWASLILQSGMTPQDLTKSLGRVPDYTGTERAASPLGVIAQVVAEVDA